MNDGRGIMKRESRPIAERELDYHTADIPLARKRCDLSRLRFFLFHLVAVLIWLSALVPLRAEWRFIGRVQAAQPEANGITLHDSQAVVSVTVLAPDLVRLRLIPRPSFGPDDSYAVIKTEWPQARIQFESQGGSRILRTSEIEVRLQLSPFRV